METVVVVVVVVGGGGGVVDAVAVVGDFDDVDVLKFLLVFYQNYHHFFLRYYPRYHCHF